MTDVAGGLITLEYALEGLKYLPVQPLVNGALSARDADIASYIRAATPLIESLTGPLAATTRTRYYSGGKSAVLLNERIADTASVTSVTEDGTAISDYVVDADAGIIHAGTITSRRVFAPGVRNIAVTFDSGVAIIPENIKLATRELVRHMVQVGKQSNRPAFDESPAEGAVPTGFIMPRRVIELCEPHRQDGLA